MDFGDNKEVWRRHDDGMDGITSSYSVSFSFLGDCLRCDTGVTPQVHCGSSLRSLQAGGCAGASVVSQSGPGFKLSWDRMEFNACMEHSHL